MTRTVHFAGARLKAGGYRVRETYYEGVTLKGWRDRQLEASEALAPLAAKDIDGWVKDGTLPPGAQEPEAIEGRRPPAHERV